MPAAMTSLRETLRTGAWRLRTGAWLTRERVRLVTLAVLAASATGLIYLLATSDGLHDYLGRPLGTDFSMVYAAGSQVLQGQAALAYDWPTHYAREQAIFGAATPFYGWHYPPFFLFVAAALALLPYGAALAAWQGATFVLYLLAMRAIVRRSVPAAAPEGASARPPDRLWILLAAAFPAVFINVGHGHNGFLTAALFGTGLLVLDARPLLAGVLFGLLADKPQFGLLIPLVLVATGRWRTLASAAATVTAMIAVTTLVFGVDVWSAFVTSLHVTRTVVLEAGNTGWHKIQSVFAWVRMWGGSTGLAYAVQGIVTVTIAAALVWLWRSRAAHPHKAAALMIGSILVTPYSLDYDLMLLAPAIALLVNTDEDAPPYWWSALAILWLMPLFARGFAQIVMVPLGVPAMLWVFVLIMRRAAAAHSSATGTQRAHVDLLSAARG
jgi:alpha-1,2-mannosyltransferase